MQSKYISALCMARVHHTTGVCQAHGKNIILTVRDGVETEGLPAVKEIITKSRGNEMP